MFLTAKIELIYIANSGVILRYKDTKVLIDGVHTKTPKPYFSVEHKTIEKMLLNKEPYNNIDLMFFTHHHSDHFEAEFTNEILRRNKHTQLVATTSVLDMLSKCSNYNELMAAQIRPITLPLYKSLQMNLNSIPFEVISLSHDGETYKGVENYAYLFEMKNKAILHVGDAQASLSNFENAEIFKKHVDYLIVPFPFIGLSAGRKIISNLNPLKVIVTHLPEKQYDKLDWIYNTKKVYKKYQNELPQTEFLTKPAQTLILK